MTSLPAEETEVGRSSTQRSEKSCGMPWKIYDRALKEYERRTCMYERAIDRGSIDYGSSVMACTRKC